jgi:hypothetical protein
MTKVFDLFRANLQNCNKIRGKQNYKLSLHVVPVMA